jgi:hypothetical protein
MALCGVVGEKTRPYDTDGVAGETRNGATDTKGKCLCQPQLKLA